MKISVVIPTFNRKERLAETLNGIFNQNFSKDEYEVIVVDDGSTDGTKEYMQTSDMPKKFKYIWHQNVGRAANRNIGIQNSSGEIIVFLDDDVIATSGLLKEHYEIHKGKNNPKLVVLGYTPFAKDIKRTAIIKYYENNWDRVFRNASKGSIEHPYWFVITNNLSIPRLFICSVGLFDEDFKNYSYEDSELGYRLFKAGMEFFFNKNALAYHNFEMDLEKSCQQNYQMGYSAVIYHLKHPELKQELSIDVAMGEVHNPYIFFKRLWRQIKPVIYNDFSIKLMQKVIPLIGILFPQKILFFFYGIIHWHYYLSGIKKGLRELNSK